jgi:hypothetical protein
MIYRPKLERFAVARLAEREPSEVPFRKGVGLVGICVERDRRDRALIVDFDREDMQRLLTCTKREWDHAPPEMTHRLKQDQFRKLSDKYGQAAAIVLRDAGTGEPVGCLTLDIAPSSKLRIQDHMLPPTPTGDAPLTREGSLLIQKMRNTRNVVQQLLATDK